MPLFDIDELKVGKDVNEAIFSRPNRTTVFNTYIPDAEISVQMCKTLDRDLDIMKDYAESTREEVVHILKESGAEVKARFLNMRLYKKRQPYCRMIFL